MEGGSCVCRLELPQLVVTGAEEGRSLSCERRDSVISSEPVPSPGDNTLVLGLQQPSDPTLQISIHQHGGTVALVTNNTSTHCTTSVPHTNRQPQAPTTATTCRRSLLHEFDKELTFRPKLNGYSLRIVARSPLASVPVAHRLLEAKGAAGSKEGRGHQDDCSFAPKLNAHSIKLAQERTTKMPEVGWLSSLYPLTTFSTPLPMLASLLRSRRGWPS